MTLSWVTPLELLVFYWIWWRLEKSMSPNFLVETLHLVERDFTDDIFIKWGVFELCPNIFWWHILDLCHSCRRGEGYYCYFCALTLVSLEFGSSVFLIRVMEFDSQYRVSILLSVSDWRYLSYLVHLLRLMWMWCSAWVWCIAVHQCLSDHFEGFLKDDFWWWVRKSILWGCFNIRSILISRLRLLWLCELLFNVFCIFERSTLQILITYDYVSRGSYA